MPRSCARPVVALLAVCAGVLLAPATAPAADGSPCGARTAANLSGITTQFCPIYLPSRLGYVPVAQLRPQAVNVGRLVQGGSVNWFLCQARGPVATEGAYRNVWWALTLSDDNRRGWTSEVYFSGGGNDEPDAALRGCDAADLAWGNAGGAGTPSGAAAPAPPPEAAPAPPAAAAPPTGVTPTAPAGPDPSACTKTVEDQALKIDGRVLKTDTVERYSSGGRPTFDDDPTKATLPLGSVDVRAATCRTPKGTWRVLSPLSLTAKYEHMNSELEIKGASVGWALAPRKQLGISPNLPAGGLLVQPTRCQKGILWATAKGVLGLPIPGIPFKAAVGIFIAGQALPDDKVFCDQLGELVVPFRIDRKTGRISAQTATDYSTRTRPYNGRLDLQIVTRLDMTAEQHR